MRVLPLVVLLLLCPLVTLAAVPSDLGDFAYQQKPGARLPSGGDFRDETGRSVRIAELSAGKPVILASVYNTLERLEQKGLVQSTIGQPTRERGGRAKRYFSMTSAGLREVRSAKKALTVLWRGVPVHEG